MRVKMEKVISIMVIVMLVLVSMSPIISYAEENLENQGTSTNNENVEFDVYYEGRKTYE